MEFSETELYIGDIDMPMTAPIRQHKVFIQGPHDMDYIRLWREAGFIGTTKFEEADVICFTGGEDVDPQLYGETPMPGTHFNASRDKRDVEAWMLGEDKIKVGICRGGQFLNVMNGGAMWQDVNNHATGMGHMVFDLQQKKEVLCSSTHHQQMIPGTENCTVIGVAALATVKQAQHKFWTAKRADDSYPTEGKLNMNYDYEILWYPDTQSLCFQPHPEFGMSTERFKPCAKYFIELLDRLKLNP